MGMLTTKLKVTNLFTTPKYSIQFLCDHFANKYHCVSHLGQLGAGETRNIQCSEIHSGRFLSIYINDYGRLSLCEVQVFGCKSRASVAE